MAELQAILGDFLAHTAYEVSEDSTQLLTDACSRETDANSRMLLETILKNIAVAKDERKPLCQSPGYLTVYVSFGEKFIPPELPTILTNAVQEATFIGLCRPSIVHPLTRKNNGDNSGCRFPNIVYDFQPGIDYVEIVASSKGCGVELFNQMKIFTLPEMGDDYQGIKRFILQCVSNAGGKACLPVAIGVGIGGQIDVAAQLSRRAVSVRSWRERNPDPALAAMENELLAAVNSLGIGAGGIGGQTTAIAVNIETAATHTAICPVVVNFHCWVARRAKIRIYPDGRSEQLHFE